MPPDIKNVVRVTKDGFLWDICNAYRDKAYHKPDVDAAMVIAIKVYDPFQLIPIGT